MKKASPRTKELTKRHSTKSETNISGGVDLDADKVDITGDVVGHDKIEVTNNFSLPRGVQIAIGAMALALVAIAIVLITRPVNISNGNFDNGLTGWQVSGGVQVVATSEATTSPVGQQAAQLPIGASLQQTVTVNAAWPQLTVWYQWPPGSGAHGRLNIYLDDQLQLALDQIAIQAPGWNVAVVSNLSNYAGKSVSLKLEYALAAARSGGGHLSSPAVQQRDVLRITNVKFVTDDELAQMVTAAVPSPVPTMYVPLLTPIPVTPSIDIFPNTPTVVGIGNVQFNPVGLAADIRGNAYVVDATIVRVQIFSSSGTYLTDWSNFITGNGQFKSPVAIAVDAVGSVYVADAGRARILKFDGKGGLLAEWGSYGRDKGQLSSPSSLAVDSHTGDVYVVDAGSARILKFDGKGGFLTQWGSYGSDQGQLSSPAGIAVDSSGNVYVADTGNNRIQKFSSNGDVLGQWGSYGRDKGQFYSLGGLAVDRRDNIYVVDAGNDRIQEFSSNGDILNLWGSYGIEAGQFDLPDGIAIDGRGNVYIAETLNHRVQKFSNNGVYLLQWNGSGQ